MSLLRTVVTVYVVVKVAPVIIKGVAYVADGAVTGITNKIGKDITKLVFGEEELKKYSRREQVKYNNYYAYKNRRRDEA